MGTLTNSEDSDEMPHQHKAAFHQGIEKKIFRQKITIFFENYKLTPLDMYNGLWQVYCIKLERRIH